MSDIEKHVSPDGLLTLVVERTQDDDINIGFLGCSWHTHAEIEAEQSGLPEQEAIRQFVDSIINDQIFIAVERKAGTIRDAWPTGCPEEEMKSAEKYAVIDENIEIRRWSGSLNA